MAPSPDSAPSPKPAIIFDLGGVLVDWNPRYLYRKMFPNDEPAMERFLAEVCTSDWNVQQDAGRPFAEAIGQLSTLHPHHAEPIRAWFERFPETISGPIEGTVKVLADLKAAGYPLYALSNWSAETFPHAQKRFEFLSWFRSILISGEVKLVKPDPRIFQLLLDRIGRQASDCIYIDDMDYNAQAATKLGFHGIHFTSPESLRTDLRRLDIAI